MQALADSLPSLARSFSISLCLPASRSILELALGTRLPLEGSELHDLREDKIPYIDRLSRDFNEIIVSMMTVSWEGGAACL